MSNIHTFFFLILITLILTQSLFPEENDVMVLNDETFEEGLKKYDPLMVLFYAPWCSYSKKFQPEFSKAASILKKDNLILAKLDASNNRKIAKKYEIKGFPTVYLFMEGDQFEYLDARNYTNIVNWMKEKTGEMYKKFNDIDDIEITRKRNQVVFIYFGKDNKDISLINKVSRNHDVYFNYQFIIAEPNETILNKYKVKEGNFVLYKNYREDKSKVVFKGNLVENEINRFIIKYALPKIMKFTERASQLIFGQNQPGLFLYINPKDKRYNELKDLFSEIADEVTGKLQVIVTGIREGIETKLAEYIGVYYKELPCVKIADTRNGKLKKYNMEGEINEENIFKFIAKWEDGELTPFYKSEKIPRVNNKPVFKLVGKNFYENVIKSKKDVLVKFYVPWCSHCKELQNKYIDVAKRLKNNTNLLIAEIDCNDNEIENEEIISFPTIKLYKNGNKDKPIEYNGNNREDDIINFVKENIGRDIFVKEIKKRKLVYATKKNKKKDNKKEKKETKEKIEEKKEINNDDDDDDDDDNDEIIDL